jgi:predicted porin
MQKKLLAVAVAGALVAPSAFAQTSVTISGALNLWYESASSTGATTPDTATTTFNARSRDRIVDGAGSNIRFTVVEDIGGGMQAFGQVESATFNNADTRNNAMGAGAVVGGWANRNSGVGLRSKAWGEILMGIWDVHYNEHYPADSHIIKGASNHNSLGLTNTFGTPGAVTGINATIGARYGNVIRYQSPNWGGFGIRVVYARPTDGVPTNTTLGTPIDNKKNRVWNFAPSYSAGPLHVGYSHLRDKDIAATGAPTFWGTAVGAATNVQDVRSDRFIAAYTFPFGLKAGVIYDRSKLRSEGATGPASSEIKRDVWVLPLAYIAGPHQIHFNYARARDWKGNIGGTDVGAVNVVVGGSTYNAGGDTGARMISLGYQYDLSKRTNLHLNYAQIRNEALAGYDFFSAPVGIIAGTGFGSDPRVYSIGLRHAF